MKKYTILNAQQDCDTVYKMKVLCRSAHVRVARADRAGHGVLVTQCATDFVRCQNSSGRLRSRSICAPRAVGWTRPGEWTPGWTAGAMSEYGCEALPGMTKLPRSAHLHPSRLCARSAGAPSTCDSLTPAVRQWRQRGLAAAVLVPSVGRPGGWCSCGLLS